MQIQWIRRRDANDKVKRTWKPEANVAHSHHGAVHVAVGASQLTVSIYWLRLPSSPATVDCVDSLFAGRKIFLFLDLTRRRRKTKSYGELEIDLYGIRIEGDEDHDSIVRRQDETRRDEDDAKRQ